MEKYTLWKKSHKFIIAVIVTAGTSTNSIAQKYEYVSFHQVKAGIDEKAKIDFSWPDKPDSANHFSNLKIRNPLSAIQTMEAKGFDLYSIHEYGVVPGVIIIDVYMRRKKENM